MFRYEIGLFPISPLDAKVEEDTEPEEDTESPEDFYLRNHRYLLGLSDIEDPANKLMDELISSRSNYTIYQRRPNVDDPFTVEELEDAISSLTSFYDQNTITEKSALNGLYKKETGKTNLSFLRPRDRAKCQQAYEKVKSQVEKIEIFPPERFDHVIDIRKNTLFNVLKIKSPEIINKFRTGIKDYPNLITRKWFIDQIADQTDVVEQSIPVSIPELFHLIYTVQNRRDYPRIKIIESGVHIPNMEKEEFRRLIEVNLVNTIMNVLSEGIESLDTTSILTLKSSFKSFFILTSQLIDKLSDGLVE